jgi:hypothetical protein
LRLVFVLSSVRCFNVENRVYKTSTKVCRVDGLMRVLFVCSGNAHRSPLAEALLRKMRRDWVGSANRNP